jgi:hypothetical protein
MAEITIHADELMAALQDQHGWTEPCYYLDLSSGEILFVPWEMGVDDEIKELVTHRPERFTMIEPLRPMISYQVMEEFTETLPPGRVRDDLEVALRMRKPFWRFKNILRDYPELRKQWFRFEEEAFVKIGREWLEDKDIEASLVTSFEQ